MKKKSPFQDPHSLVENRDGDLEAAIGRQVRALRKKLDMRVTELAKLAGLSSGMISKIENGLTSPSLSTLSALSGALNVPVTALFQQFEERHDATFVPAGQGLKIERRGTRNGHEYLLLGHSQDKSVAVEPYMITLTDESEIFPFFQHAGSEFIYILSGGMSYRHGDRIYTMKVGDSLFFDASVPHGPESLDDLPCNFITVIAYLHGAEK
ncbi:MAG: XRE family transcriptional regulator [Alphaproteobacteria bacterium]|jgi:transcriptional regulator with XRE-family HTH domain